MSHRISYLTLLLTIIGLCIIAFVDASLKLKISDISDIDSYHIERMVRVRANITGIHRFEGGSIQMTLDQSGWQADVFIPSYIGFEKKPKLGQLADVTGVVRLYRGRLEIFVESSEGVELW